MKTILITGARRGIGLELARQFVDAGWRVHACSRSPENSRELLKLASTSSTLSVHLLDVCNDEQLAVLAASLKGQAIDVLLNNAGVYGEGLQQFGTTDRAAFLDVLAVNALSPLRVMEAFVDHVASSELRVMANMSSKMGSMHDNASGGAYAYRASKAALNAVVVSAARNLAKRDICVVALHPGWVRTDMGGPDGELSVEQSAEALRTNLCELTQKDSGRFIDIDGTTIPW